jgi:hypothetical protein
MLGVIGSKQNSLEIQKVVQNFIKEKLNLNMKKQKGLILSTKSKMAKYLGALITCYNTKSIVETLNIDKVTSKQLDFN